MTLTDKQIVRVCGTSIHTGSILEEQRYEWYKHLYNCLYSAKYSITYSLSCDTQYLVTDRCLVPSNASNDFGWSFKNHTYLAICLRLSYTVDMRINRVIVGTPLIGFTISYWTKSQILSRVTLHHFIYLMTLRLAANLHLNFSLNMLISR